MRDLEGLYGLPASELQLGHYSGHTSLYVGDLLINNLEIYKLTVNNLRRLAGEIQCVALLISDGALEWLSLAAYRR